VDELETSINAILEFLFSDSSGKTFEKRCIFLCRNILKIEHVRFLKFFVYYLLTCHYSSSTQENNIDLPPNLIAKCNRLENILNNLTPYPDLYTHEHIWRGNPRFSKKPYAQMLYHWIVFFLWFDNLNIVPIIKSIISYTFLFFSSDDLKHAINLAKFVLDFHKNKHTKHPSPYNINSRKKYSNSASGIFELKNKNIKSILFINNQFSNFYSTFNDSSFIECSDKWVLFSSGSIFNASVIPNCYLIIIFKDNYIFPDDFVYFIDNKIPETFFSSMLLYNEKIENEIHDLIFHVLNQNFDVLQTKKRILIHKCPSLHQYLFDSYSNFSYPSSFSIKSHKIYKISSFLRKHEFIN